MDNKKERIETLTNEFIKKNTTSNLNNEPNIIFTYDSKYNKEGLFNVTQQGTSPDPKLENETLNMNEKNKNKTNYSILNEIKNDISHLIVLDSSYNPPTLAHLKLLSESLKLSRENGTNITNFLLLITNNNVDKELFGANLQERLAMMEIIAQLFQLEGRKKNEGSDSSNNEELRVLVGLTNSGKFIDKITAVQKILPKAELSFIMGYDTITRFFMKKYYVGEDMTCIMEKFFNKSRILCAERKMVANTTTTSNEEEKLSEFIQKDGIRPYAKHISILSHWMEDEMTCSISSTSARNTLKQNYQGTGLITNILPKEIIHFILKNNIYKSLK